MCCCAAVLPFFNSKVVATWIDCRTAEQQHGNTGFLINRMNPINSINSRNYRKTFIFFLIYVSININLQKERVIICSLN